MRPIAAIVAVAIAIIALASWYVVALAQWPTATVQAAVTGPHTASLTIDTVPNALSGPHPDWVQYQTGDLNAHQSATIFRVPVDTWVTVTIHQYDSSTALRNPFFGLVEGTKDGIAYLNGKPFRALSPDIPSHTFAIPDLGINVPLAGVPATATGDNPHETITFTFYSGKSPHLYRWQCFDPCGWGVDGNGGPMSTFGFMGGEIFVG